MTASVTAGSSVSSVGGLALRQVRLLAGVALPLYLLATWKLIGLRVEHVAIAGLFFALFMIGPKTARFGVLALPFLLVGILYDNLRLVLSVRGEIHVADLYNLEKALFSVTTAKGVQTLPEFWKDHPVVFFDVICGFAYLAYLGEAFLFGTYLFFRDQSLLKRFAWTFLLVNVLGMITYLVYPAAPPWYVEEHGLGPVVLTALPSAAGAARFDELFGIHYFQSFYSRNANVFGAMPSLHVAYPTVVALATRSLGKKWLVPAIAFAFLVAFSAVYLRHHYVLDVTAGAIFGAIAWSTVWMVERWWRKRRAESEAVGERRDALVEG